ncbi:MAG TPA: alpha/beta hydrolase [Streptomyces sp.]
MIGRRTFTKAVGAGTVAGPLAAAPVNAVPLTGAPKASAAPVGFPRIKQVRAGLLDIGYAELGPAHGPAAILLHGWPYDVHSYAEAAPLLAAEGYRVIVPYLRGHGTTRFLSERTFRNAQQSAIALDVLALMDALKIERAVLGGFDWGSRTADIVAALWPERCAALVSVSGYLVTNREANLTPLSASAEHTWWYQYYFATERGRLALEDRDLRRDLARLVWETVSPTWDFDDATFDRTATAFDNPDYPAIVLHNYRWRLSLADGEHRYDALEKRLAARPTIGVPTVTLDPERDPFTAPGDGMSYRDRFTGPYLHRTLTGVGHNLPQEAPAAFAQAVIDAHDL